MYNIVWSFKQRNMVFSWILTSITQMVISVDCTYPNSPDPS